MNMNIKQDTHLYEIDLLRFLAALCVVFFHYAFRGNATGDLSILAFPEIAGIVKYGYLGIDLFFMISGFVILLGAMNSTPSKFIASRIARLYPAFWVGMTLTTIVTIIIGTEKYNVNLFQYIINLSMVPTIFGVNNIDGVYWTLLIEAKFYFLILIILLIKQIHRIQIFAFLWLTWSLLFYYYPFPYRASYFLFPYFSSYFIGGAMIFLVHKDGLSISKILLILGAYITSLHYAYRKIERQINHFNENFDLMIVFIIITFFYVIMILIAMKYTKFLHTPMLKKNFVNIGLMTYPLYLIHQNIGYMIFNYVGTKVNNYIILIITILIILLLSYSIHLFVEKRYSGILKQFIFNMLSKYKKRL